MKIPTSRLRPLALALIVGTLAAPPAWALSLSEAYQAALEQDATLRGSRAANESARERLPMARSQFMPYVTANFARTSNRLNSISPGFGGPVESQENYFSSNQSLTVRQPLYRPNLVAQYKQTLTQMQDADAAYEKDVQNLANRVAGAYFDALLASDSLRLILAQKTYYTAALDQARKARIAGSGIQTDIDDAQARLDMAVAQELEARQNVDYTRRGLQILINRPVDTLQTLDVQRMRLEPPSPNNVEDWLDRAERNSPEIISQRAQVEGARLEIEKAQSGHKPTVDAVAQWTISASENVISTRSQYNNKSVGVQLSVPIFNGGYVNAQVRQALADLERAEQALEATRRDLGARVHAQFRAVTEGVLKVRALEQTVRSAETLVRSTRRAFEAGSRTQVDVLNADQQRSNAVRDLAQARYTYMLARVRLDVLVGDASAARVDELSGWLQP